MRDFYKLQIRNGSTGTNHVDEVLKDGRITSHIDYAGVEFEKLNKGDVLLIHKGSYPFCLVEVQYKITNKSEINGTDFGINYKVKILSYFEDLEESLTFKKNNLKIGPNGTFTPLYNDSKTLRFIKEWFYYIEKKEKMQDKIDLLKYKKQIILQGPPGTGKTRLAKIIANHLLKPLEIEIGDILENLHLNQEIVTSSGKASFSITGMYKDKLEYVRKSTKEIGGLKFSDIQKAYKNKIWLNNAIHNGSDTYSAAIAKYIYENFKTSNCKLIQFHPSYTYEDFVRGIVTEPNENGEGVLYKTENKILADLAEKANENYLLSQDDNTDALEDKWIDETFEQFRAEIEGQVEQEKLILSGDISIFKVESDCFRYGVDWLHPSRINYLDFKKIIKAALNKKFNIDENQIPKGVSAHAHYRFTYYLSLLRKFFNKYSFKTLSDKVILKNYVLIIDEINRANLPSVLGELIYALEYRDEPVDSMYPIDKKNELILPSNLFIIGTMNTADRSVGHIDYAIKRRFAFVDVLPSDQAIDDVVKEPSLNLKAKGLYKKVAELFNEKSDKPIYLQSDFKAKDVQLGHSYFLVETEKQLELKLEFEIKPLLNEYVKDGVLGEETLQEIESLRI
ncbi:5-methylcytosine-specific restriction enzyme B [compost metagenome]